MITDQLSIFSDNVAVRANAASNAISVMPLLGKGEAVRISVAITEAYPATAGLNIAVQESKDGTTFTSLANQDVPKEKLTRVGSFLYLTLPASLRAQKLRLNYTVTGSPSTGRIWTGITEDVMEPYESGQFARAGKVTV